MSDDPIERLDEQREADIALRLNGGSDPMVFDEAEAASLLRIIRRQRRLIERLARERDDATLALSTLRDTAMTVEAKDSATEQPVEPGSFADGYRQGQDDLLYGLVRDLRWAVDRLAKARVAATMTGTDLSKTGGKG